MAVPPPGTAKFSTNVSASTQEASPSWPSSCSGVRRHSVSSAPGPNAWPTSAALRTSEQSWSAWPAAPNRWLANCRGDSGQKEERWTQLLAGEPPETEAVSDAGTLDAAVAMRSVSLDDVVTSLRADVDALREEVQRISTIVETLRSTFDL